MYIAISYQFYLLWDYLIASVLNKFQFSIMGFIASQLWNRLH